MNPYTDSEWGDLLTSYYNSGMNTTATKKPFKYQVIDSSSSTIFGFLTMGAHYGF